MNTLYQYRNAILGACTLSLVSLTAVADGGGGKFMEFFDANQDHVVTMSELDQASKDRFAKMDADANGVVTQEEFQAYVGERRVQWREQRFGEVDGNADNQISKEEYLAYKQKRAEQRYLEMDADNDGIVTKEEFLGRERGFRGGKHGHRGGRFFARLDANEDGQLTLDESLAAWSGWFKRIDANSDHVVTEDEVKAFRYNLGK